MVLSGAVLLLHLLGVGHAAHLFNSDRPRQPSRPAGPEKRYNAQWALVTGASGIGKELAKTLAAQGLNVVLVALDDELLHQTFMELHEKFTHVEFRRSASTSRVPTATMSRRSIRRRRTLMCPSTFSTRASW